jgi:hypothetical protein
MILSCLHIILVGPAEIIPTPTVPVLLAYFPRESVGAFSPSLLGNSSVVAFPWQWIQTTNTIIVVRKIFSAVYIISKEKRQLVLPIIFLILNTFREVIRQASKLLLALAASTFLVLSPMGLMNIFYCLTTLRVKQYSKSIVTVWLAVYRQSVCLGAKPLSADQTFFSTQPLGS